MSKTQRSQFYGGEYWFTVAYSAKLLGTTAQKIETMAMRGLLRSNPDLGNLWVAEADIGRLRHDPALLKKAKAAVRLPNVVKPIDVGGEHIRSPRQEVLGISDHRFPLSRRTR